MKRKIVLLHDQQYMIGGPKAVLEGISNSFLRDIFEFRRITQEEACGLNPIKAIRFIRKYKKLIDKERADVIYVCGLQYSGLLMTLAARLSNVKRIVLSVHGSDWDYPNGSLRKKILMYCVEPLEVRLAHSVITVCEAAQKTVGSIRLGEHDNNDGVVYNTYPSTDLSEIHKGIFKKEIGCDSNQIIVTSVGRVLEDKGHQFIIDAMKKMKGQNDYVFVIVGDGPFLDVYKDNCQDEIKNGSLKLLGRRSDIYSILADTDIFLFPTLHENHSIALLEAVKSQCAVICTNVGGNPEIIENNVSGILIPPRDSDSIVEALGKLKNAELRKHLAERADKNAKVKFSVDNTYGKLASIFNK